MTTGFECEFAEKVSKGIQAKCPICLLVLREPYQATCCGKSFCKECIHQVKATNKACPTCSDKDFNLFCNKGLQQSLYDFQVYCTHKSKGCEWTGELRELDNHLNSSPPAEKSLEGCPHTLIKCPLSCAGCEKGVCRKDIKSHVNDKLLSHVTMQSAQMNSFERQLQKHRDINTQLQAQLKEIKEDKKSLEKRITELETKISELNVKSEKLDVQNRELEKQIKELKTKSSVTYPSDQPISKQRPVTHVTGTYKPPAGEFTMTDFEEYRRDNDEWYSSHFYTHPNGYKMCLRVDASGTGGGKGTHLSVSVFLMCGEFDDQLKWPFCGNVTFKLVNQEEDKDHVIDTVYVTRNMPEKHRKRVTKGERSIDGWGRHQFLSLTKLQPKYLKNDCIKLCIKKVELF